MNSPRRKRIKLNAWRKRNPDKDFARFQKYLREMSDMMNKTFFSRSELLTEVAKSSLGDLLTKHGAIKELKGTMIISPLTFTESKDEH